MQLYNGLNKTKKEYKCFKGMGTAVVKSAETITDQLSETDENPAFASHKPGSSWKGPKRDRPRRGPPFQEMLRQVKVHKNHLKLLPSI